MPMKQSSWELREQPGLCFISACGKSVRMKLGLPVPAFACLALSLAAAPAFAASVSSSFGVSATVESGCQAIAYPGSLATSDGVRASATPAVQVNCTNPTAYSVGFSPVVAKGGTVSDRKVSGAGSALSDYRLVSGLAGRVDRGETVSPDAVEGKWSADPHTLAKAILEARAQVDQSGAARVYPDTITVTITY
jgi:spore coat protein U-like protein